METTRFSDGVFAVRLVHFNAGWRYWAFRRQDGADIECGLSANGYESMSAAKAAIRRIK